MPYISNVELRNLLVELRNLYIELCKNLLKVVLLSFFSRFKLPLNIGKLEELKINSCQIYEFGKKCNKNT